jgi:flagellar basal-body rod protein FlgG
MMRSLYTAASGMTAQQLNIDVISNNLSNVNTAGFKKSRVDFEDLLYQTQRMAGTASTINHQFPVPVEVGLGTQPAATPKIHTMGKLQGTENNLDVAIEGEGFFKIRLADGREAYSRDGALKIDAEGNVVTSNGNYLIDPPINVTRNYVKDSFSVSPDGLVTIKMPGLDEPIPIGEIKLYRFVNPAGLQAIGSNLLVETDASGAAFEGIPNMDGFGTLRQGMLEMSNVEIVEELVNMIVAQRAYEFNSKAIQTSDSMLSTAVQLKR